MKSRIVTERHLARRFERRVFDVVVAVAAERHGHQPIAGGVG